MEERSIVKRILALIGAVVVIAGIAYAVYEFIIRPRQDVLEDDEFEDTFDEPVDVEDPFDDDDDFED